MPTLACTPRRLVLLALGVLISSTVYFTNLRYAKYLPRPSIPILAHDGLDYSSANGLSADVHPDAQAVDVSYLATTFGFSEPILQRLIDAPTTQSVKDLLRTLGAKGHDYDALRTEQLQREKLHDVAPEAQEPASPPPPAPPAEPTLVDKVSPHKDYDPRGPSGFEWDTSFYINNGITALQDVTHVEPEVYRPYPNYNSPEWKSSWRGDFAVCRGARGKLLNVSDDDLVKVYPSRPLGFPNISLGDAGISRLRSNTCFDRYHRYGPYGLSHGRQKTVEGWKRPWTMPDWTTVAWHQLQDQCIAANQNRFFPSTRHTIDLKIGTSLPSQIPQLTPIEQGPGPKYHHRTAVLLRTTHDYHYTENDLQSIRAMITELSLLSGGEYQVFNLVHVQDESVDLFGNPQAYDAVLRTIPKELRSISILWNDGILRDWYPKVGYWDGSFHSFMALQWFIVNRPEFDFVWNWDLDTRFIGNHYELLEGVGTYARVIPRKHMWERNQRYYVPALHDKDYSYDWFLVETDDIVQKATRERHHQSVWGPQPYDPNVQRPVGPPPPTSYDQDGFQWGSGDDADLITLQPIFNPAETSWEHKNNIWNFFKGVRPDMREGDSGNAEDFHQYYGQIPRRASLGSTVRLSKRQLYAMHLENLDGRTMHPEMWAPTVALQHGLKAVFAAHPVWTSRVWTADYLNGIFNADRGEDARWSETPGSVFDADRIHNFDGLSWGVNGGFAKALYRRWMGWSSAENDEVAGIGGEMWEQKGLRFKLKDYAGPTDDKGRTLVGGRGRMCLPPMLLHPVGDVYEAAEERPEVKGVYG